MYGLPDSVGGYYALKYIRQAKKLAARDAAFPIRMQFDVVNVKIYQSELNRELISSSGMVWRFMERRGQEIVARAKKQVGVRTGALRQSIYMKHYANQYGQYLKIGSNLHYAYIHHEGSRPHIITPTKATVLRFNAGGRVIYSRSVVHPGTRPNRYLSNHLRVMLMKL